VRGDLRVRHFGDLARVEMGADELTRWSTGDAHAAIESAVREAGYERVEIDPRGFRSGALNELARVQRVRVGS
jgi:pyridinium-3,5-biscarboxylic acid mononucleotide sulfurtransferase